MPKKRFHISSEYVGEGDRSFRVKGCEFPLVFLSNRFSDFGYDAYLIKNKREYQKCLFNDEFTSLKPAFSADSVAKAKAKSAALLSKNKKTWKCVR